MQFLRHSYCFKGRRILFPMTQKKTALIGASTDTSRYAYKAANSIVSHGHELVPLGIRPGVVAGQEIVVSKPQLQDVDTVTLYVGPQNQTGWYDYILDLKPKRIIFNPGTENPELEDLAEKAGIEVVEGCTLVMLSVGTY